MFINPNLSGEPARYRHREILASAGHQRVVRPLRAPMSRSRLRGGLGSWLCSWGLGAAARLRGYTRSAP